MSESASAIVPVVEPAVPPVVCSPPPSPQPPPAVSDPGLVLLDLARQLIHTRNRRLMLEYLRLRRQRA